MEQEHRASQRSSKDFGGGINTMKQINCNHYIKASKKTSVYTYKIVDAELNLCKACEKKLRKEVLEQIDAEDYLA